MKQIGVFGGSFDPPHCAHVRVARAACQQLGLDTLLWIPARQPPHKPERTLARPHDRLNMVRLMTRNVPGFAVDTREFGRPGPSWTVLTLESLHEDYPSAHFWLIVGSDSLAGFASWREPERIQELASLAVYERRPVAATAAISTPSAAEESSPAPTVRYLEGTTLDISSTDIRERLRRGESTEDMLPPAVQDYIRMNHLYQ